MILRFKPQSKAENEVQKLIAHRDQTEEYAKSIVEKITGIKPKGFGYHWFFGISYSWDCNSTGFDNTCPVEIDGMKFTRENNEIRYFKPNKRSKKGKLIADTFHNEQTKLRTDSKSLEKFGIFTHPENSLRYSDWSIGQDENGFWMSLSDGFMEFIEPHPEVLLQSKIPIILI